jgi:adenine-specific DNA-methyltransferase
VMASLAGREGLRGKVQCIYVDPPYGIKFNSNWQVSTQSPTVKDGRREDVSREPEQVKAFRDTWKDGINSYLTYLRDRLTVAKELLTESGSIFVQIGDENVHLLRALLDEIFGQKNFVSLIAFEKTSSTSSDALASVSDYILWFSVDLDKTKFRPSYKRKILGEAGTTQYVWIEQEQFGSRRLKEDEFGALDLAERGKVFACDNLTSQRPAQGTDVRSFQFEGYNFTPGSGTFKTDHWGLSLLARWVWRILTSCRQIVT